MKKFISILIRFIVVIIIIFIIYLKLESTAILYGIDNYIFQKKLLNIIESKKEERVSLKDLSGLDAYEVCIYYPSTPLGCISDFFNDSIDKWSVIFYINGSKKKFYINESIHISFKSKEIYHKCFKEDVFLIFNVKHDNEYLSIVIDD